MQGLLLMDLLWPACHPTFRSESFYCGKCTQIIVQWFKVHLQTGSC